MAIFEKKRVRKDNCMFFVLNNKFAHQKWSRGLYQWEINTTLSIQFARSKTRLTKTKARRQIRERNVRQNQITCGLANPHPHAYIGIYIYKCALLKTHTHTSAILKKAEGCDGDGMIPFWNSFIVTSNAKVLNKQHTEDGRMNSHRLGIATVERGVSKSQIS